MAIPLILGAVAAAAAATGIYKGGKAVVDNNKAGSINDDANNIVESSKKKIEASRVACDQSLTELGQRKADTLSVNVKNFLETFGQIKNVDFTHDGDFGNLKAKDFKDHVLNEMRESVNFITSSGLGATGGSVGGALAAYGAYSSVMALGTASTGTAIGTLSGAAATNATLAWLGGGSIAAGGGGMALGTAVLTGVAAGPAILIAGWYMGSKASQNLDNAHSNLAEAKKFRADVNAAVALTDGIRKVADKSAEILSELRKVSRRNVNKLKEIIAEQGTNYAEYNDEAKAVVMANVKTIQVIKVVLDTPILDENGALLGDADANLVNIEVSVQQGLIA